MMPKIDAIVQARMSSTRLPGKVLMSFEGETLLEHVIDRVSAARCVGRVIVAVTDNPADDVLEEFLSRRGVPCFRGSENDVLARFHGAASEHRSAHVLRVTPDDPFKDPEVIDAVADAYFSRGLEFAYNNHPPTFPEGLDTEIFSFAALSKAHRESSDPFEREHMTQYLYRHPELFRQENLTNSEDLSRLRWTVDTPEDFAMAERIFKALYGKKRIFLMADILGFLEANPGVAGMNSKVQRSHHYR